VIVNLVDERKTNAVEMNIIAVRKQLCLLYD